MVVVATLSYDFSIFDVCAGGSFSMVRVGTIPFWVSLFLMQWSMTMLMRMRLCRLNWCENLPSGGFCEVVRRQMTCRSSDSYDSFYFSCCMLHCLQADAVIGLTSIVVYPHHPKHQLQRTTIVGRSIHRHSIDFRTLVS